MTFDLFHWLTEVGEYSGEMQAKFDAYCAEQDEGKDSWEQPGWLELMEGFASDVREGGGIYGEGQPFTENSYNGECLLSQTIQFTLWEDPEDDETYALVQVHGGCDVRGGYTAPKVFRIWIEGDSPTFLDYARCGLACDGEVHPSVPHGQLDMNGDEAESEPCVAFWTSDDAGYRFSGEWNGSNYAQHDVPDIDLGYNGATETEVVESKEDVKRDGKLYIIRGESDRDGTAVCPHCGDGKLSAWYY